MNAVINVVISFVVSVTPCLAEVITDGTVGQQQNLAGPHFQIGQDLGTLRGHNLFHSFSHFNVDKGQSATFTGSNTIQNVVSRVTGGEASNINGTLKSDIGHATFYFINPAGIVFGKNARVDVPGAFYASTAGQLQFADGKKFNTVSPHTSSLSMAAPEAFGFVGKQTGKIAINGANLFFKSGTTVQLSAAQLNMDKAKLTGEGMDLHLVALGNAKQRFGVAALPKHALQGIISLKNTELDASGNGTGRIAVRAGDVTAKDSDIYADNKGNVDMSTNQGIDMQVGKLNLDNTVITSDTTGAGNTGTVKINAKKELAIINGGKIQSNTFAAGDSGNVVLKARSITIDGRGSPYFTGITSSAQLNSRGKAGSVKIAAQDKLEIINGGLIQSSTFAKGNAGRIYVKAGAIRIDGQDSKDFTGIASSANPNSSGNAGELTVIARNQLVILNGGEIQSDAFAEGKSGNIDVKAGAIRIDGQGSPYATSIASDAGPKTSKNGGRVRIIAENQLVIINGGSIQSGTFGKGDAGSVDVKAGTIQIDGQGAKIPTGISSGAEANSSGKAGKVMITANDELALINDGTISTRTFATGNGGHIVIKAGNIRIDGHGSEYITGITSDTFSKGSAGRIDVKARNIRIDGQGSKSFIGITSGAQINSSGNAGTVNVVAKNELALVNNGLIDSSTVARGNAGTVNVNAGTIKINGLKDSKLITGILSAALKNATGSAGSVNVTAIKKLSMDAGQITIRSDSSAKNSHKTNSNLIINAPRIEFNNNSQITAQSFGSIPANPIHINTSQLSLDNSSIKTTANQGNGGPITINAKNWARLHNSQVTTSVASKENGNGGDISISADVMVMDTGFIQANTNAQKATGGNVKLSTKQLIASSGNLQSDGNTPLTFKANSGINVIQAAAPNGINGNIAISAPKLNIVGSLAGLNSPQFDMSHVGHNPCSNIVRQSTIKNLGKGSVPLFNKGKDGYTIDRLLPKTPNKQIQTKQQANIKLAPQECQSKPIQPLNTAQFKMATYE